MCHVVLSPFRWQSWMSSCEDLSLPCSVHEQNVGCGCYQFSPDWADKSHVTARLVPVWDSLRRRVGPPFADRSRSSPQHTVSVWDDRERLGWQLPSPVLAGLHVDCQLSLYPLHGTGTATVRGGRIRSMAASPGQHFAPNRFRAGLVEHYHHHRQTLVPVWDLPESVGALLAQTVNPLQPGSWTAIA